MLKKYNKWILFSILAILPILFFFHSKTQLVGSPSKPQIIRGKAKFSKFNKNIYLSGVIMPLISEEIRVKTSGLIKKFLVRTGQAVTKGQLLVETEQVYLDAQIKNLDGQVQIMEQRFEILKEQMILDKKNLEKNKGLLEKGTISIGEFEQSQIRFNDTSLNIKKMNKEILNQVANREELKKRKQKSNFYSSIDGIITHLIVDPSQFSGSFYNYNKMKLGKIQRPNYYVAKLSALDSQIKSIPVGSVGHLTLGSTVLNSQKIPCVVSSVSLALNSKDLSPLPGIYNVNCDFKKEGDLIREGVLTEVNFLEKQTDKEILTLPWTAIKNRNGKYFVNIMDENANIDENTSIEREIVIGKRADDRIEILKGLLPSETVELFRSSSIL